MMYRIAGYTNTADCLENAICSYEYGGTNGDLAFGSGTSFSNLLKSSSEYQSIKQQAINIAQANRSIAYYTFSGSTVLSSNADLYLALHKVDYTVTVEKYTYFNYNISISFHDTYDFAPADWQNYGGTPRSLILNYIVNYAYEAQCANIIDPYEIYLYTTDQFYLP